MASGRFVLKNVLYRHFKEPGRFKCEGQAGIELPFLDGIDRLPRNPQLRG
jgi:hypothetical protein